MDFIIQNFNEFLTFTGFANASAGNLIMILVGALFIWLAIKKDFEPLLLVPIGLGIILGNIPFRADAGTSQGHHPRDIAGYDFRFHACHHDEYR